MPAEEEEGAATATEKPWHEGQEKPAKPEFPKGPVTAERAGEVQTAGQPPCFGGGSP